VNKFARISATCVVMVLGLAATALAQEPATGAAAAGGLAGANALIEFGGAFGVGLTVIGAAYGIGKLASSALESMARQPEVAGSIQTAMIIAAALIEGFTFYALVICSGK
jgi:F-type H+-transporting ATPase subunit c